MLAQVLGVAQLAHHDGLLLVLVGVDRRDAAQGGAVLLVLQPGLLQTVEGAVEGEDDGGAVGDLEVLRGDGNAGGLEVCNLLGEVLEVDDGAVAQHVDDALGEDARGDEVQGELAVLVHHGVAGVVAALIADDDVIIGGDQIDHAALALVAPVDAYHCAVAHSVTLLFLPRCGACFFVAMPL